MEAKLRFARANCIGLAMALCCVGVSRAQEVGNPVGNSAQTFVEVVQPLTIESTGDLRFGGFTVGATLSNFDRVFILPDGSRAVSDPTAFVFVQSVPHGQATFHITGEPGALINVLLPNNGIGPFGHLGSASSGLLLENLSINPFLANPHGLPNSGDETFPIGGTLRIDGPVQPGNYSVPFTVTVEYQ